MPLTVREQLERVAQSRVLFAHQSVGQNLLDGLGALAFEEHVPLRIAPFKPGAFDAPGLLHAKVGENGRPETKWEAFAALVAEAGPVDLAAMKLCYADFFEHTDVPALFERFAAAHQALQEKHPRLRVMVVTVPLTAVQSGLTVKVKHALGRPGYGERENVRRHQFNQRLRHAYENQQPFFDLAAAESGGWTFEHDGQQWPRLRDALTDDGGHLNARGQKELALAFAQALAAALG